MLKEICARNGWDINRERLSFEQFLKANKKHFKNGFVDALPVWEEERKNGNIL
jgi:hypothetical protein